MAAMGMRGALSGMMAKMPRMPKVKMPSVRVKTLKSLTKMRFKKSKGGY